MKVCHAFLSFLRGGDLRNGCLRDFCFLQKIGFVLFFSNCEVLPLNIKRCKNRGGNE